MIRQHAKRIATACVVLALLTPQTLQVQDGGESGDAVVAQSEQR